MKATPCIAAMAAALVFCASAQANSYMIIDLGPKVIPTQFNKGGEVTGYGYASRRGGTARVFRDGRWRKLGDPRSIGYGINSRGDVVDSHMGFSRTGRSSEASRRRQGPHTAS